MSESSRHSPGAVLRMRINYRRPHRPAACQGRVATLLRSASGLHPRPGSPHFSLCPLPPPALASKVSNPKLLPRRWKLILRLCSCVASLAPVRLRLWTMLICSAVATLVTTPCHGRDVHKNFILETQSEILWKHPSECSKNWISMHNLSSYWLAKFVNKIFILNTW